MQQGAAPFRRTGGRRSCAGACAGPIVTALPAAGPRAKPCPVTHSPAPGRPGPGPVAARYDALVASGAIERDPAQLVLVARLDALLDELARVPPPAKPGMFGRLFGRRPEPAAAPRGLYVWGLVGRGKTMLMDLFHEAAPEPKRRSTSTPSWATCTSASTATGRR